jgi:hypothetical protein
MREHEEYKVRVRRLLRVGPGTHAAQVDTHRVAFVLRHATGADRPIVENDLLELLPRFLLLGRAMFLDSVADRRDAAYDVVGISFVPSMRSPSTRMKLKPKNVSSSPCTSAPSGLLSRQTIGEVPCHHK